MGIGITHSVGYHGLFKLRGMTMLCTGGNVALAQEPIMGTGVWGAGYKNVAPVAWAWNYLNLDMSANIQLTNRANQFTYIQYTCVDYRDQPSYIELKPDGYNGFSGAGWSTSLSFDASQGAAITASMNFKGDPSGSTGGCSGTQQSATDTFKGSGVTTDSTGSEELGISNKSYGANGSSSGDFMGAKLIPYWKSVVFQGGSQLVDIISWNISYNTDLQMLKCMNDASQTNTPLSADYIVIGQATSQGSYTQMRVAGDFAANKYHRIMDTVQFQLNYSTTDSTQDNSTLGNTLGASWKYLKIPKAIINSGSVAMSTGAQYLSTQFSFTGVGNGQDPLFSMSSIASSGGDAGSSGGGD